MPSEYRLDKEENTRVMGWYEDSLSLVNPSEEIARKWKAPFPSDLDVGMEILYVAPNGNELLAHGNPVNCRSYLANIDLEDHFEDDFGVVRHGEGVLLFSKTRQTIRLVFVSRTTFSVVLEDAFSQSRFTNAELQLLLQLLCGHSIRSAAEEDDVSYETKRSQFKSLTTRAGFKTQNEAIRKTLLALTSHSLDAMGVFLGNAVDHSDETLRFLNAYYPGQFRVMKIMGRSKRVIRLIETGPVSGTPVIWLHSQTLPPPSQFSDDWCEKENIRLIIPLREGFLSSLRSGPAPAEHLERAAEDIADVIHMLAGGRARIVAQSTGVAYAIQVAREEPQIITGMTFAASAFVGEYRNHLVGKFVDGFRNLLGRNPFILSKSYDRYMNRISTREGLWAVLSSTYEASPRDMSIFEDILSERVGHTMMYDSYRLSRHSVVSDIGMRALDVWRQVQHLPNVPTMFVHGETDPINSIGDARLVQKTVASSQFVELKGEGQSLFLSLLKEVVCMPVAAVSEAQT